MSDSLYIGIDVGTGSARAALTRFDGTLLHTGSYEIRTWRYATDHRIFEQSTSDIWGRICAAVKDCLEGAAQQVGNGTVSDLAKRVRGIGFDATCSLAVTDFSGEGVSVTDGGDLGLLGERNIILWADHRAEKEADEINGTGSVVLDYVGGKMSLEMEIPKILWLKRRMSPELFERCQFFDLPDYLTYRATGSTARSCCSLTCKCSYVSVVEPKAGVDGRTPPLGGWDDQFFHTIGLGELVERGYGQIGRATSNGANGVEKTTAGIPVGKGLSKKAAEELGLEEGIAVGSGLIDAYAGWLGTVGARCVVASGEGGAAGAERQEEIRLEPPPEVEESGWRLVVVAGTSSCHIVQSKEGIFVKGIWGPYRDPVFPGWWMNEGGQSATGQLIEHIISTHSAKDALYKRAKEEGTSIYAVLHDTLENLRVERNASSYTELTKDLHIYPDFHGNRSPIADPRMRGSITGLNLDGTSLASLALLYHATLTSIALQTRSIVDELNSKGHHIKRLYVSGSQAQNGVLMQLLADACYHGDGVNEGALEGVVVSVSDAEDAGIADFGGAKKEKRKGVSAVVLGAAMLGRMAHEMTQVKGEAGDEKKAEILWNIMMDMTPPGVLIPPTKEGLEKRILNAKYEIFLETVEIQKRWRDKMDKIVTAG
ncbi:Pentulose kinase [Coprinellus micaceus]|uniref:Pentulose kinase n=1 Tax=Coprinellus micaceus TaxID=71717 RepID=A0A4Y7T7B3_COPMI|nr:Pentulose kinase [Coprinellus micaceus]